MSGFESLHIEQWRQYKSVDINFHPSLTVITGPNGTGKSTILSILSGHFGYNKNYLATPERNRRSGKWGFSVGVFSLIKSITGRNVQTSEPQHRIGKLVYQDGNVARITVPRESGISYPVNLDPRQTVEGLHIDSHRQPTVYRAVPHMPTTMPNMQTLAAGLNSEMSTYYTSGNSNQGATFHIKSALISMSIFGHGNPTMTPAPELLEMFEEFQEKLRKILPKSLGFEKLIIRPPEVILSTKSGEFVLDAASGGVIKLFEITWQIYMFARGKNQIVITMDEPENHLHPSMQRTFLKDIIQAFPNVQFVVVSHSPFIVSSVRNSSVYVLGYESLDDIVQDTEIGDLKVEKHSGVRVVSQELDTVNKAANASEILRDALGVPTTIPDWAEDRLQEIVSEFSNREVSDESLDELAEKLRAEGLASDYPAAVQQLMNVKND